MTATLDRRQFLAGTGAMFVAAALPRLLNPKTAFGALQDPQIGPALVDPTLIDSWLAIGGDGTVTILTGKVELGTGVLTTTLQLVADELDVPLASCTVVEGDTWRTPDQGFTAGSQSNKTQYAAKGGLRQAAAEARLALLGMASARLGVPVAALTVKDGVGQRQGLLRGADREPPVRSQDHRQGGAEALPGLQDRRDERAARRRAGQGHRGVRVHAGRARGRDGPRARGAPADARLQARQGRRLPGRQESARVSRHRRARATSWRSSPRREEQAIDAAASLKVTWETAPLPSFEHLYGDLQRQTEATNRVLIDTGDVEAALAGAVKKVQVNYRYPIQMHGSMGASCAVASVVGQTATVWSSTQGVYPLRDAIATALGFPKPNVHVSTSRGPAATGSTAPTTSRWMPP